MDAESAAGHRLMNGCRYARSVSADRTFLHVSDYSRSQSFCQADFVSFICKSPGFDLLGMGFAERSAYENVAGFGEVGDSGGGFFGVAA